MGASVVVAIVGAMVLLVVTSMLRSGADSIGASAVTVASILDDGNSVGNICCFGDVAGVSISGGCGTGGCSCVDGSIVVVVVGVVDVSTTGAVFMDDGLT